MHSQAFLKRDGFIGTDFNSVQVSSSAVTIEVVMAVISPSTLTCFYFPDRPNAVETVIIYLLMARMFRASFTPLLHK